MVASGALGKASGKACTMGALNIVIEVLSRELLVMLTAALPVVELRGAIPVGLSLGMSPLHAVLLSLIGSMLPVPFILLGVRPVFKYLRGTQLFRNVVGELADRTLSNHGARVQKYGAAALILVVAVPLPGTGVWTGSLVAALLDIRLRWAFPAILMGNIVAAIAVLWLSYGFFGQ